MRGFGELNFMQYSKNLRLSNCVSFKFDELLIRISSDIALVLKELKDSVFQFHWLIYCCHCAFMEKEQLIT